MLDGFPQRDFVLWVFMCPTNISLFCDHLYCTGYHAEGYHAPSSPPRAITPVYTSRLSHQSYHAPPHTYIGLSHPLRVIRTKYFAVYLSPAFTPPVLLHLRHHRGATRTNLLHTPTYIFHEEYIWNTSERPTMVLVELSTRINNHIVDITHIHHTTNGT